MSESNLDLHRLSTILSRTLQARLGRCQEENLYTYPSHHTAASRAVSSPKHSKLLRKSSSTPIGPKASSVPSEKIKQKQAQNVHGLVLVLSLEVLLLRSVLKCPGISFRFEVEPGLSSSISVLSSEFVVSDAGVGAVFAWPAIRPRTATKYVIWVCMVVISIGDESMIQVGDDTTHCC